MAETCHGSLFFCHLTDFRQIRGRTITERRKRLKTAYFASWKIGMFMNINFMLNTVNCFAVSEKSGTFAYRLEQSGGSLRFCPFGMLNKAAAFLMDFFCYQRSNLKTSAL